MTVFNPYLPLNEYIPDGEPHVFGDRVYVYGSHDRAQGMRYCEGHYAVWSAPVDDLSHWTNEGTAYYRTQDPSNAEDDKQLWAPDLTQGPDGRYYLYYCFSFYPEIGVAVSDSPAGPFEFYGHVHYPAHIQGGKVLAEYMPFDPAVLTDDDGRVYLYYGFAPAAEKEMKLPEFTEEQLAEMPPAVRKMLTNMSKIVFGENSMVVELEPDMVTTKEEPRVLIPGGKHTAGTGFEGHGFFEASSIRKFNGKYYFVYSSHKSHELCYAVSDRPDAGFVYGGTIVSNGDVGLDGRTEPINILGNNHGGLEKIGDDYYIFYHRQTHGSEFSRQGCAEKVILKDDGSIDQVEITSCGLNGAPLPASGVYPAAICCHLTDPTVTAEINYQDPKMAGQIQIREEDYRQYITNIKDGACFGFKYFDFAHSDVPVALEVRGDFTGTLTVALDATMNTVVGSINVTPCDGWHILRVPLGVEPGVHPLYFCAKGAGVLDVRTVVFE